MKMVEIMPIDVRRWVVQLKDQGHSPHVIRQCHTILSAIFTTALNDLVIHLHPSRGVKTPPAPRKLRTIITPEQFDALYAALPSDTTRLLVELDVETGLRWGELTELRVSDFDADSRTITVSRVAVELTPRFSRTGARFVVKEYPKDREHRRLKLGAEIATVLEKHIIEHDLTDDALLFSIDLVKDNAPRPQRPITAAPVGKTEPNAGGRSYAHGSLSGYSTGKCRCEHCRRAYAR
jgi:integrase